MKMKVKTIWRVAALGLLLSIALLGLSEPVMAQSGPKGKIHVLFVWGTLATDVGRNVVESKEVFEDAMESIGICDGGQYIASFTSLSDNNASPEKILAHCKKMAQEAGPNDALFVYILSHGCSAHLDGAAQNRENLVSVLFPNAIDSAHLDLRKNGVERASIIKAMKSNSHRLNVLITDSSSLYFKNLSNREEFFSAIYSKQSIDYNWELCAKYGDDLSEDGVQNRLLSLLLNSRGTINWNSSYPFGGYSGHGEISFGNNNGTLFTQAFIKVACTNTNGNVYTRDTFLKELGAALNEDYKKLKKAVRFMPGAEAFLEQDSQTLTEFDDDGHVKRTWSEADQYESDNDGVFY